MIPDPWTAIILALGVYRLTRLLGWDDFPPVAKVRAWVVGEHVVTTGSTNARMGLTNEPVEVEYSYRRPTLSHFLHCPFCLGAWLCLGTYIAWRLEPSWTLTVAFVFAMSGAVGLVARNLDP